MHNQPKNNLFNPMGGLPVPAMPTNDVTGPPKAGSIIKFQGMTYEVISETVPDDKHGDLFFAKNGSGTIQKHCWRHMRVSGGWEVVSEPMPANDAAPAAKPELPKVGDRYVNNKTRITVTVAAVTAPPHEVIVEHPHGDLIPIPFFSFKQGFTQVRVCPHNGELPKKGDEVLMKNHKGILTVDDVVEHPVRPSVVIGDNAGNVFGMSLTAFKNLTTPAPRIEPVAQAELPEEHKLHPEATVKIGDCFRGPDGGFWELVKIYEGGDVVLDLATNAPVRITMPDYHLRAYYVPVDPAHIAKVKAHVAKEQEAADPRTTRKAIRRLTAAMYRTPDGELIEAIYHSETELYAWFEGGELAVMKASAFEQAMTRVLAPEPCNDTSEPEPLVEPKPEEPTKEEIAEVYNAIMAVSHQYKAIYGAPVKTICKVLRFWSNK